MNTQETFARIMGGEMTTEEIMRVISGTEVSRFAPETTEEQSAEAAQ